MKKLFFVISMTSLYSTFAMAAEPGSICMDLRAGIAFSITGEGKDLRLENNGFMPSQNSKEICSLNAENTKVIRTGDGTIALQNECSGTVKLAYEAQANRVFAIRSPEGTLVLSAPCLQFDHAYALQRQPIIEARGSVTAPRDSSDLSIVQSEAIIELISNARIACQKISPEFKYLQPISKIDVAAVPGFGNNAFAYGLFRCSQRAF